MLVRACEIAEVPAVQRFQSPARGNVQVADTYLRRRPTAQRQPQ